MMLVELYARNKSFSPLDFLPGRWHTPFMANPDFVTARWPRVLAGLLLGLFLCAVSPWPAYALWLRPAETSPRPSGQWLRPGEASPGTSVLRAGLEGSTEQEVGRAVGAPPAARPERSRGAGLEELKPEDVRVLVVEDEVLVRNFMLEVVQGFSALTPYLEADQISPDQIHGVASVQEATAWIQEHSPQLVLTDLNLIGGLGFAVADAAKATDPSSVVVLVSSPTAGQERQVQDYLNRGVLDRHLPKPVPMAQIRQVITTSITDRLPPVESASPGPVAGAEEVRWFVPTAGTSALQQFRAAMQEEGVVLSEGQLAALSDIGQHEAEISQVWDFPNTSSPLHVYVDQDLDRNSVSEATTRWIGAASAARARLNQWTVDEYPKDAGDVQQPAIGVRLQGAGPYPHLLTFFVGPAQSLPELLSVLTYTDDQGRARVALFFA